MIFETAEFIFKSLLVCESMLVIVVQYCVLSKHGMIMYWRKPSELERNDRGVYLE
jgi:hypothetical protein